MLMILARFSTMRESQCTNDPKLAADNPKDIEQDRWSKALREHSACQSILSQQKFRRTLGFHQKHSERSALSKVAFRMMSLQYVQYGQRD